jgi:hypothetical protein
MIKCPCQGCEKRTTTCHSTCEDYKAYATAIKEKREIEYKKRMEHHDYMQYQCDTKSANLKR